MVRRGLAAMIGAESDLEVCGEAADGGKAAAEIDQLHPDIVVADISMPGRNGIELIKDIRARHPAIEFVVLTGHDESVYALRVLKAGAKGYVMKQESTAKVIEAIRTVSRGRLYVSESVASQMLNRFIISHDDPDASPVAGLSDRELEVVTLIGAGHLTREIAVRMNLSVKTVETHRANIKAKIRLINSAQLVQFCIRWVEDSKRLEA